MRFITLKPKNGVEVSSYNSRGAIATRIASQVKNATLTLMYLTADSCVGRRIAPREQLFICVLGSGWVAGDDGVRMPISEGQTVLWLEGDAHESGADSNMTAVIVEGEQLANSIAVN